MRRSARLLQLCAVAALVMVVSAVSAEEILHFTNGTTMAIRGHEVHDDMIHVDLGGNAFIAFPESQVERITAAGRDVYLPGSHLAANVAAESRSGIRVQASGGRISVGNPVRGSDTLSGSARRGRSRDAESIEELMAAAAAGAAPAGRGLAVGLPGATNPRARALRVTGRSDAYRGGPVGTGRMSELGRTFSGETKLMTPGFARKAGLTNPNVKRFLPSEKAAAAGVAQGNPLKAPPPPRSSEGAGSSGEASSGSSDSPQ